MKQNFDLLKKVYHSRGFRVVTVHADEEFEKLRSHMLPSRLVSPDPGGHHVPLVERSIRTLKESCRAAIHGLPYTVYPKELLRGLIRKVILMSNAVPGESGISNTLSPRNLVENLPNLDFHSIKIPFGAYCQLAVDEQITNTTRPRTIGAIVLDPVGLNQKYRFMSLESGQRVSGRLVRILPVTEEVIDRVNEIGSQQKQARTREGRLLFEWRPGLPIDEDVFLADEINGAQEEAAHEAREQEVLLPEPIEDEANERDAHENADEPAREITEDDSESCDPSDYSSQNSSDDEDDNSSSYTSSDDDGEENDEFSVGDSRIEPDDDASDSDDSCDDDITTPNIDTGEGLIVELTNDGTQATETTNQQNEQEGQLGRGMRERHANPKYYGHEFANLQFLQHSFEALRPNDRAEYLQYALNNYAISGKTGLVERYLAGVVLTQMSGKAGLKKHGKEGEKCLLKEFTQFKNMDVMDAVDPDTLTPEQKKEALGMVSVMQEKRDHTPTNPSLKYRACADGRKQRSLYTKEETTSPALSPDGFLLTHPNDRRNGEQGCSHLGRSRSVPECMDG